jgi:hypothetical protein
MAKIQTQSIVITLNKLVKDSESDTEILVTTDMVTALEQVAQELAGTGVVVETQIA